MKHKPAVKPLIMGFFVFLVVGIGAAVFGAVRYRQGNGLCRGCNVVIIDIDGLRSDALRCFSEGDTITPNLCALVRQSTYFTKAFSQAPWTAPSEYSMITSLYPNRSLVGWSQDMLNPSVLTMAQHFQNHAYQTAYASYIRDYNTFSEDSHGHPGYDFTSYNADALSAWPAIMGRLNAARRPYFFHGYISTMHMPYLLLPGETPLYPLKSPKGLPNTYPEFVPIWEQYVRRHATEIFSETAVRENAGMFRRQDTGEIIAYFKHLEQIGDTERLPNPFWTRRDAYLQYIRTHNPDDASYLKMMYESKVFALDAQMKPLTDYLLRADIASKTVIVLTSSHGEAFGEHAVFGHYNVPYNEAYHVPLAIRIPGFLGSRNTAVTENLDLFPTLSDITLGSVPEEVQGKSLRLSLKDSSARAADYAISMNNGYFYTIQDASYKLTVDSVARRVALYDLQLDPGEYADIVHRKPETARHYFGLLNSRTVLDLNGYQPFDGFKYAPGTREKLIERGYF